MLARRLSEENAMQRAAEKLVTSSDCQFKKCRRKKRNQMQFLTAAGGRLKGLIALILEAYGEAVACSDSYMCFSISLSFTLGMTAVD